MTEAELQELLGDREVMPIYDESIFFPEEAVRALGFTDEDIQDAYNFVRWHMMMDEKISLRNQLIQLLRARQNKIAEQRQAKLRSELAMLEQMKF